MTLLFCRPKGVVPSRINQLIVKFSLGKGDGEAEEKNWTLADFSVCAARGSRAADTFQAPLSASEDGHRFKSEYAGKFFDLADSDESFPRVESGDEPETVSESRDEEPLHTGDQIGGLTGPKLPELSTRVLVCTGTGESARVSLMDSKGKHARYACLSYTWGQDSDMWERYATLAAAATTSHGVSSSTLSGTIRDAAEVTVSLGLTYLWVDGLCIWQNDEKDKQRELPYMSKYYSNATLVIQPSGTHSVNDGFLHNRVPKRSQGLIESSYLDDEPVNKTIETAASTTTTSVSKRSGRIKSALSTARRAMQKSSRSDLPSLAVDRDAAWIQLTVTLDGEETDFLYLSWLSEARIYMSDAEPSAGRG